MSTFDLVYAHIIVLAVTDAAGVISTRTVSQGTCTLLCPFKHRKGKQLF